MDAAPVVVELDFDKALDYTKDQLRELIAGLEEKLKGLPQMELPLNHYFSRGVYGRELKIPKGTLIVGKIHKYQVMNVVLAGEVSVLSIDGVMRIKAPHTFVSSPGAKRVIYAHEDSVWMNFLGTDETDTDKIEAEFIAKDYSEVKELEIKDDEKEPLCLTSQ